MSPKDIEERFQTCDQVFPIFLCSLARGSFRDTQAAADFVEVEDGPLCVSDLIYLLGEASL